MGWLLDTRSPGSWAVTEGPYRMIITKVQGARVFGHVEFSTRRTVEFDFVGILDGNRLRYRRVELMIDDSGDSMVMRGTAQPGTENAGTCSACDNSLQEKVD
jgi:hypothetical protein